MAKGKNAFDGIFGAIAAKVMSKMNAATEEEAIENLFTFVAPTSRSNILIIGFGSGYGIKSLNSAAPNFKIYGIDPSGVMNEVAAKLNSEQIASKSVKLAKLTIDTLTEPDNSFDGAIAVNSLQLFEPIQKSLENLRRLLKDGAPFVSITHDWAAAHHAGSAEGWIANMKSNFLGAGFKQVVDFRARAEKNKAIAIIAN